MSTVTATPDLTPGETSALIALGDLADRLSGSGRRIGNASARQVAKALWPDSPAWEQRTHKRLGVNGAVGGTMPMKAGRVLRALERKGMVYSEDDGGTLWYVTFAGQQALAAMGEQQ